MAGKHRVLLVGIGGAGSNFLDAFQHSEVFGRVYINTDKESLEKRKSGVKIFIGEEEVEINKLSESSVNRIYSALGDADVLVMVAGIGGLTGTGVLPEVLRLSSRLKSTVISVVFIPFRFESRRRDVALGLVAEWQRSTSGFHVIDLEDVLQQESELRSLNDILMEAHILAENKISQYLTIENEGFIKT